MTKLKIALLMSTAAFGFASAQSPARVTASTLKVTQVTENGKTVEKLVDASKGVLPGDTLEMKQRLDNLSEGKLTGVRLTMPIPAAVTFLSQQCSMTGVKTQYSTDAHQYDPKTRAIINVNAKKFADAAALTKTVIVKENGADVKKEVNATPADYTAVRWQLPDLAARQPAECSIRVKVK